MKITIGVISDTHIPDKAKEIPRKILEAFKKVDMIIHCGDLVELSVLDKLKECCKDVRAVKGNMDHLGDTLMEKEIFMAGGVKIAVAHGSGAPNMLMEYLTELFKGEDADAVIFGHSHSPLNEKKGKVLFFNPGSATDKIFAPYNSYGMLEIDDKKITAKIVRI
jgi:uncharacterized protein